MFFVSVAAFNSTFSIHANPGDLDSTFGVGGKVITNPYTGSTQYDFPNAVAIQPDGKIIAAGSVTPGGAKANGLIRYNSDGSIDTNFGNNGIVWHFLNSTTTTNALEILPDGKILAAGDVFNLAYDSYNYGFVCRYNSDGSHDLSFAGGVSNGCQIYVWYNVSFNTYYTYLNALAVQPDGKIVAAGYGYDKNRNYFAVIRLNADGSYDNSFSGDGQLLTSFVFTETSGDCYAQAVAVNPTNGKIIVAGYIQGYSEGEDFALKMLNADGSEDTSFGGTFFYNGRMTDFLGGNDRIYSVTFVGSKILVAGMATSPNSGEDFAFARYNPNGTLDNTFGFGGRTIHIIGNYSDAVYSMKLQTDGKIVAAGYAGVFYLKQLARDFAVARYQSNGAPDTTFSGDGKLTTDFGMTYEAARSVAIQADGKIVAAGHLGTGQNQFAKKDKFALARYEP